MIFGIRGSRFSIVYITLVVFNSGLICSCWEFVAAPKPGGFTSAAKLTALIYPQLVGSNEVIALGFVSPITRHLHEIACVPARGNACVLATELYTMYEVQSTVLQVKGYYLRATTTTFNTNYRDIRIPTRHADGSQANPIYEQPNTPGNTLQDGTLPDERPNSSAECSRIYDPTLLFFPGRFTVGTLHIVGT
ncbi:hypothetical protein KQX54_004558 [Cotesia glomerata]|uniref:Uncharacterized protein n=1 Tax=Cotesia glomerata TaxID=32391 RepID=A0AAV7I0U2_COTGL|nr:hypothetical protein KQX54_004558 [Cotesia glomerata]